MRGTIALVGGGAEFLMTINLLVTGIMILATRKTIRAISKSALHRMIMQLNTLGLLIMNYALIGPHTF